MRTPWKGTARTTLLAAVACLAVTAGGCALGSKVQYGGGNGMPGYKTVSGKEEPVTLWAVDGTQCQVTPGRYQRIKVGDRIWCAWRGDGEAPRPGGMD